MSRYKAYAEYKDSGVEWIGSYPCGWELTRVKFESYVKARVGWHGLKADDFTTEGPYLVTGSDFRGPVIKWEDCYHCDFSRYEQDPNIQLVNGDLLITKDGTIGKVALVSNLNGKATLNSGVFVVRPLEESYISKFYFWLLHSSVFTGFVDFSKTGSTIVHLYQDTFVNFRFAMPHLIEQEKITNFLDHETAKIDTLIAKHQGLIKLLKEKRQAVISHAVTKGLDPNAPMRDSCVEWLGEVPEHWEVLCIKHIVSIPVTDGPHETPNFLDSGVPFISAEAVSSGRIDFEKIRAHISKKDNKRFSQKYSPKKFDIYMVKSGATTGVTAINETDAEFNIWSPLAVIRCNEKSDPYFILNFLRSINFKEAVELNWSVGTQQNIGMGVIENLHVTRPPISEAKLIAKVLLEKCFVFDKAIDFANRQIEFSKERRAALISAAITGKIDVSDEKSSAKEFV
ncbi:restriction endonuclease subunit S [Undibacterium sp.]|uniref:restriction endonuclease subunit S n=1 Tax=Undibacterium sp. TaxID=1914977 RepID=UPI002731777C|nr:restriction endonuclease subunit S [Undibacterium sp.]MDP1977634.1 restriction endonuclease subunit S [Undibacterium sp.]